MLLGCQSMHLCCCNTEKMWASWWWFKASVCKNGAEENFHKQTEMATLNIGVNRKPR